MKTSFPYLSLVAYGAYCNIQGSYYLEKWLEDETKDPNGYIFAIRLKDDMEKAIGYCALSGVMWVYQSCWLEIGLSDESQRGKGYGKEAMRLLIDFGFRELNMHRIQLTVFSYNEPALALYKSLGFTQEGIFRESIQRDGQRFDMLLFGILRDEWNNT